MKVPAILEINGKEIKIEIPEEEIKKLIEASEQPKKTGYERVDYNKDYYYVGWHGKVEIDDDAGGADDDDCYETANYYSDETVAENNARADALMRKLRRFAVEHRETGLTWNNGVQTKWEIYFYYDDNMIKTSPACSCRAFCNIYFDTEKTAKAAIEEFKDELIWYFTEYRDSL